MRLVGCRLAVVSLILELVTVVVCQRSVQAENQGWKTKSEPRLLQEFDTEKQQEVEGGRPVLCMTKMHFGGPSTVTNLADDTNFLAQLPKRLHHTYSHYEHNSQTVGYFGHQTLTVDSENGAHPPQKSVITRRHARQLTLPNGKHGGKTYQRGIETASSSGGTSGVIRSNGFYGGDGLEARGQFGMGDASVRDIYHTQYEQPPLTSSYGQQSLYSQPSTGIETLMDVIRSASGQEMTGGPMSIVAPSYQGTSTDVHFRGQGPSTQEIGGSSSHSKIHYDSHKANADASAHGNYGSAQAQTQVRGGASRDGTFDAKAHSGFEYGMVQSQVQGRDRKATSSSQSQVNGVSQSQTQVQMDYNDRHSQALAQGQSPRGSFTSAVQGGKRKGQASSQAQGQGQTSSAVQMDLDGQQADQSRDDGDTTNNETHEVSATAQGGYLSGQSQTQLQGTKSLTASAQSSFGDVAPHSVNGSEVPSAVVVPTAYNNSLAYGPTSDDVAGSYPLGIPTHTNAGQVHSPFSQPTHDGWQSPTQGDPQYTPTSALPHALDSASANQIPGTGLHLGAHNGGVQPSTASHHRHHLPANFVFPSSLKSNKSRKWYSRLMSETAPTHSDAIVPRSIGSHAKFGKTGYHQPSLAGQAVLPGIPGSVGYPGYTGIQTKGSIPYGQGHYTGGLLPSTWTSSYGSQLGTQQLADGKSITVAARPQLPSQVYPNQGIRYPQAISGDPRLSGAGVGGIGLQTINGKTGKYPAASATFPFPQAQTGGYPAYQWPAAGSQLGLSFGDPRLTAISNGYGKVKTGLPSLPVSGRPGEGISGISALPSTAATGTAPHGLPTRVGTQFQISQVPVSQVYPTGQALYPTLPYGTQISTLPYGTGTAAQAKDGKLKYPVGVGQLPGTGYSTGIYTDPSLIRVANGASGFLPGAQVAPGSIPQTPAKDGSKVPTAVIYPSRPSGGPQTVYDPRFSINGAGVKSKDGLFRYPLGGPQQPTVGGSQLPSQGPSAFVPTTPGVGSVLSPQLPISGYDPKSQWKAAMAGGRTLPVSRQYPSGGQPSIFYPPGTTVQTAPTQTIPLSILDQRQPTGISPTQQNFLKALYGKQYSYLPGQVPGSIQPQLPTGQVPGSIQPQLPTGQVPGPIQPQLPTGQVPGPIQPQLPTGQVPGIIQPQLPTGQVPGPIQPQLPTGQVPGLIQPQLPTAQPQAPGSPFISFVPGGLPPSVSLPSGPTATRPQPILPGTVLTDPSKLLKSGYVQPGVTGGISYPSSIGQFPGQQIYPTTSNGRFYPSIAGGISPQISSSGALQPQVFSKSSAPIHPGILPQQPYQGPSLTGTQPFDPRYTVPVSVQQPHVLTGTDPQSRAKQGFKSTYGTHQITFDPTYFQNGVTGSITPTPTATPAVSETTLPTAGPTVSSAPGQNGPQALVPPTSTSEVSRVRPPCKHHAINCAIVYKKNKPYKVCNLVPVDCSY